MKLALRLTPLAVVMLLLLAGPGHAARPGDEGLCRNAGAKPLARIVACSRLLKAARFDKNRRHELFRQRAAAFKSNRMYKLGIADYSRALRLKPRDYDSLAKRADLNLKIGRKQRAIRDLDKAARFAPLPSFRHFFIGLADIHRGKLDRADRNLATAGRLLKDQPVFAKLAAEIRDIRRKLEPYRAAGAVPAPVEQDAAAKPQRQAASVPVPLPRIKPKAPRRKIAVAQPQPEQPKSGSKADDETATPKGDRIAKALPAPAAQDLGKRIALVIGNARYEKVAPLANPLRDAASVAATLRRLGFTDVRLVENTTRSGLREALIGFAGAALNADWAVIYYAGHGMELGGGNYLIPVDATLATDRHVRLETVALSDVIEAVGGARKFRLVILDACRDNPFQREMKMSSATRSIGRGLARVEPTGGTLVAYAARDGQIALDGEGTGSPFATALVNHLARPGVEVGMLFRRVRDQVLKQTGGKQEPFTYGSLPSETLYFNPPRQ